jgi:methylenetetrahydrofolate dehydrogenase (NADP+)/methenyltetrahydrofolate cyclohydrolase
MPARLIDGKAVAKGIRQQVKAEIEALGFRPGLGVILVGDDPASHLYVRLKERACQRAGIDFRLIELPADTTRGELIAWVDRLNDCPDTDAFIVQLPLPPQIDENLIISRINPLKDADGFHPVNLTLLAHGQPRIRPVLAQAVVELLASTDRDWRGQRCLTVSNSQVFYRPLAQLLEPLGLESDWASPDDPTLAEKAVAADLLIVAVGRPGLIAAPMVKPGATVIDIGTNRENDQLTGDVDFAAVNEIADWITPVPGGVGPVTVACLLKNTVELAKRRRAGTPSA